MAEQSFAKPWRFATLTGEIEAMDVFRVRLRRLASGRFEGRREKTGEQKSFLQRRSLAGKLRSGETGMFGEHGWARWRNDFVNDLLFGLPHADREMAGDAARAGCPSLLGSPRLILLRRGVCATRWTAHAMAVIFRVG
jgi:hypothetical protein